MESAGVNQMAKRAVDLAFAIGLLILASPVMLLVALLIKLEDGGPVFYRQRRVGQGGRLFWSYKFRTMVPDAEARWGPRQASRGDPRVTRIGRLLRATALDELPQLWNVLVGDMSMVGPRALLPEEIEVGSTGECVPMHAFREFEARHRIRPGLTGLAQVYADRMAPRRKKFRYDLLYIRRQSLALDLRLIVLSVWISLWGRWAVPGSKVWTARRRRAIAVSPGEPGMRQEDVECSWGSWAVVDEGPGYTIKRLAIKPGHRMSLPSDGHGRAHVTVVRGMARIQNGDRAELLHPYQSVELLPAKEHGIENPGPLALVMIQTQDYPELAAEHLARPLQ